MTMDNVHDLMLGGIPVCSALGRPTTLKFGILENKSFFH